MVCKGTLADFNWKNSLYLGSNVLADRRLQDLPTWLHKPDPGLSLPMPTEARRPLTEAVALAQPFSGCKARKLSNI